MLQNGCLTAEDRQEQAENIDPLIEASQTMDKEARLNRSSFRSSSTEESSPPRARMTGRPPVAHSPQRMTGRPPYVAGMPAEDRGRDHRRLDATRHRYHRLQDRFGARLARSGDHRDRNTDRQDRREDRRSQSRTHRDRRDHSRSRSGRPEAARDRRADRQDRAQDQQNRRIFRPMHHWDRRDRQDDRSDHRGSRNDRQEPQSDRRDAHIRRSSDHDRGRTDQQEPSRSGRSRSRSARDRDQDRRRDGDQASGQQEPVGPEQSVDSWPPAPKRRRAPLLGNRSPPSLMPAQRPPAQIPPQERSPEGVLPRSRVSCWRGPPPPVPPDEMDSFEADVATSNADGGPQDSSARTVQHDHQLSHTTTRIPFEGSVLVPDDVENAAHMPFAPEGPSNDSDPMSLVERILAEMEKEPELAVLNRPPLRSVQPSNDNQAQAENGPLLRPTNSEPMRLHFDYFNHDVRPTESEQVTTPSSTSTVDPPQAEARPEVMDDPPTSPSDSGPEGSGDLERRLAAKDHENAALQKQVRELQDGCYAMELQGQQTQEKHEKVLADQRAEIALVKQMFIEAKAEASRLTTENRRLQEAAVVHIDGPDATDERRREVAQLRQDVEEHKRQAEEAKKDAGEAIEAAEEQKRRAEEFRKETEEQTRRAEELRKEAEEAKKAVEEVKIVAKLARKEAERAADELRQSNEGRATLRQDVDRMAQELEQMRKQNAEQTNIITAQQIVSNLEKQRKDDAERQLNAMRMMLKDIARRLRDKRCLHCIDTAQMSERLEHLEWDYKAADDANSEYIKCIHEKDQQIFQLEGLLAILREQFQSAGTPMEDHQPSTSGVMTTETTVVRTASDRQEATTSDMASERDNTPHNLTSTPHQETSGPHQQTSGPNQQTSGPLQQTSGPHQQTSGPHQETSGPHRQTSGPHQETSGPPSTPTGTRPGPPVSSGSPPKMRAIGSEDAARPTEAVPAEPPQPDGLHEPVLTRKSAQRGPGVHQSVKQEVVSQATTDVQATSPTGNRRSTDSGIGIDATPPSRPHAGPQSSPDRPHGQLAEPPSGPQLQNAGPQQRTSGPQQHNSGLQQRPVGPPQQTPGPQQYTSEPYPQTVGPHQRTSGPHHQNSGPQQQTSIHHQQPVGPHQQNVGPHPHMFGAQQLTSGPHQQMFGPQQHTTGPHQVSSGPFRQVTTGPHQPVVGPPGGSRLRAILERPPGPPAASIRQQGPPQRTTPAQNAIPGGPQWQTAANFVPPPLDRLGGWLPPGLTPICTTPLICHIQGTYEYVEIAADAATGAPVFSLPNQQLLQNAVANYNRVHQTIQVPRQQPGSGPQRPTQQPQQQPRSSTRRAAPRQVTLADIPALAPCVASAPRHMATAPPQRPSGSSRQHAAQNVQQPILDALVDPQQFAQAMNASTTIAPTVPGTSRGAPPAQPSSIWPPASNSYPTFMEQVQQRGMAEAALGLMDALGGTGDDAHTPGSTGRR